MLKITNVNLQRGSKELLQNANLLVTSKQKVGIIGKNGCGKSSFFSLLLGNLKEDAGEIEFSKQLNLAHLAQEIIEVDRSAIDFVIDGDEEYRQIEGAIQKAETEQDGLKLAELHEKMHHIDGYTIHTRAGTILHGLGFTSDQFHLPLNSFSGGWRMRVNLAKTLMTRADLFLLDEPTNHLDLETIVWLEKWLKGLQATILIISHDRDFIDGVCDHIAHFENAKINYYTGNYSSFEQQRTQQLALQQATFEKQQRQRAHLQSYVDRFRYKASKARQAQSRIKLLEKMELVSPAHYDSPFSFSFPTPKKMPTPLIRLDKASIGYSDPILSNVNLTINPGDRFGVLGPNGAGKSTLMKLFSKDLTALSGEVFYHNDLKIGYFTQHQSDYLDLTASPLLHLQRLDDSVSEQKGRDFLGRFDFHGDMALQPITHFSGGEKARLALALLIWQEPNLLLLDEPTNHFDLDMRHALTLALNNFDGAIVLISHDRHLIKSTMDELLLVYQGKVSVFQQTLDAYPACLDKPVSDKKQIKSNNPSSEIKKDLAKQLKSLESKIEKCQNKLEQIHQQLEDTSLYEASKKQELDKLLQQQDEIKQQLTELEEEWLLRADEE